MIYGYARVSTDGQSVKAQVKQMRDAGAEKVFHETASGRRDVKGEPVRKIARTYNGSHSTISRLCKNADAKAAGL